MLSGDRSDQKSALTPYLPAELAECVDEIGRILKDRGFGTARFKRTKVLNWACAILFHKPNSSNGQISTPSTAAHINSMLDVIGESAQETTQHKLYQRPALRSLAEDIHRTVVAHQAASDAWSPKFRSKKGQAAKWEELPLVASLVGTFILVMAGKGDALKGSVAAVRKLTGDLKAPQKTQNKTQWQYIARVAVSLLDQFQVQDAELGPVLESQYGHDCLPTLRALAATVE